MRGTQLKHMARLEALAKDRSEFDDTARWTPVLSFRCRLQQLSERELVDGEQQVSDATHEVICRFRNEVKSDMRLVIQGRIYHIASVLEVERQRWLRLLVVSRNLVEECC